MMERHEDNKLNPAFNVHTTLAGFKRSKTHIGACF